MLAMMGMFISPTAAMTNVTGDIDAAMLLSRFPEEGIDSIVTASSTSRDGLTFSCCYSSML